MKSQKPIILIIIFTLAILFGGVLLVSGNENKNKIGEKIDEKLLIGKSSYQTNPKGAKVTIVEFGDYECPACAFYHPEILKILKTYKNQINYVFRHFPLPQHKNALNAARAVEAAGEQGKFFEMHDLLFENQDKWSISENSLREFASYASKLKLNKSKFEETLNSDKYDEKINLGLSDGARIGIQSTPTYFINGIIFEGNPTFENLKSKIDPYL